MSGKLMKHLLWMVLAGFFALNEALENLEILKYFQKPEAELKLHNKKETNQRISDLSYPCIKHNLQTEDGYIISVFQIPYSPIGNQTISRRPKVLLQHGLLSTSDGWILNGPHNSLPFMLADQGFDVWLGNSRGNLYGRKHVNYTTAESKFWRFSWHEIGYYDLAAMIDYILEYDGAQAETSLHYIGHSQGCTALMVLLSLRPEYQGKLKTTNLMAPGILFKNTEDHLIKILGPYLGQANVISQGFASHEFLPFNELFSQLSYNVCKKDSAFLSALQILLETHPGGISTDQIIHFTQLYQSGTFRQFDFGLTTNLAVYQQFLPPDYPLGNIKQHLHLWYGLGDRMTNWKDIVELENILSNVEFHRIPDVEWSHGDFMVSLNSRSYVNEPILEILVDYEKRN